MQLNFRQKKRQLSKADITVRQVFVPAGTVFNVRRTHKKSLRPLPLLTEEGPEAFFLQRKCPGAACKMEKAAGRKRAGRMAGLVQ